MANKIEQVISELEEYIDGCKVQAFSNSKVIVDRNQIEEYLSDLRQYTPEEVKKYQRMLNNRDKILSDAKKKAEETELKAQAYAEKLVAEDMITKMAKEQAKEIITAATNEANRILQNATHDANEVRSGAYAYTGDMLNNLHAIISGSMEDLEKTCKALSSSLADHREVIEQNLVDMSKVNYLEEAPEIHVEVPDFFNDNSLKNDFSEE